ncbi:MAG: hypothetical protein EP317_01050 [Bacillota bacterium]|nr:MAG: hypothetical protein EP317_01050 [Bacillota bacterium]
MNKKTTQVKQTKLSFWGWVHKYRLKIVTLSFIVLVPLALLASVYIGSFTNNRKIYFDQEVTNETVMISKYRKVNPDQIDMTDEFFYEIEDINNQLDLYILWDQLNEPYVNSETGDLDFGTYRFKMYYKQNEGVTVNTLNVLPLLQTDWVSIRSLGTQTMLTQTIPSNNNIMIIFNHLMPKQPLPLVTVESPHLYLKVSYQVVEGSQTVDKVAYIQFDLENANPRQVS